MILKIKVMKKKYISSLLIYLNWFLILQSKKS